LVIGTVGAHLLKLYIWCSGLQKYARYATKRNLIIIGVVVALMLLVGFIIYQLLDNPPEKKVVEGTRPLEVKWKGLGAFKTTG